eukprot:524010-Prorocentrum_minimum.AAC.11
MSPLPSSTSSTVSTPTHKTVCMCVSSAVQNLHSDDGITHLTLLHLLYCGAPRCSLARDLSPSPDGCMCDGPHTLQGCMRLAIGMLMPHASIGLATLFTYATRVHVIGTCACKIGYLVHVGSADSSARRRVARCREAAAGRVTDRAST